ncbi:MAG: hypothetical protein U0X58_04485 [Flavobacteriaceae bacterium]
MKKIGLYLSLIFILMACEKDAARTNNNPYLPYYSFSVTLNLNLPLYSDLNTNLNPKSITLPNGSQTVIMRVSDSDYRAWNGNCPNQSPTACSVLSIEGLYAKCGCDDHYQYSIFDGTAANARYAMVPYRVEVLGGNSIRIYN